MGCEVNNPLSPEQEIYLLQTEERVRSPLFRDQTALSEFSSEDNTQNQEPHWVADYRRLRVIAHKP